MPRAGGWLAVAGARPNFVKLAPLVAAARRRGGDLPWVHTGQHWDDEVSDGFARAVGLPAPVARLEVGAGDPTAQTARVLERLAPVLARRRPSVVVVIGDVTSTLAAALAAVQARVPVAHVEAGLRSFDRDMAEERNRVLVDHASERLYVTEPAGVANLRAEGVPAARIALVGNPALDALRVALPAARALAPAPGFVLATLHRARTVDDCARLAGFVRALGAAARRTPVVWPVHPRTADRLRRFRLRAALSASGVRLVAPLGYVDFVAHLVACEAVVTDSGGVQEEASVLGVPCLTLRAVTERPLTVERGTNVLVGEDPRRLGPALARALRRPAARPRAAPRLWDGHAADRIVADLAARFAGGPARRGAAPRRV